MNRKKVNGAKTNESTVSRRINERDSNNSTDSFDMKDFKSSSLTKKYSVQIHKNNADLMAELNNINIMGDESDVEIIEPKAEQNGISITVSDGNTSKVISLNSTHTSDEQPDEQSYGDSDTDKHERVLAWAQSQSQNLSMCVESVLSDHDYLSQELLLGIIASNEERIESQREKSKSSDEIDTNKQQNGHHLDKDGTIIVHSDGSGNLYNDEDEDDDEENANELTHSNNENTNSTNMNDLSDILKQLNECKDSAQSLLLLQQIEEKTNKMKEKLNSDKVLNNKNDTSQKNTKDSTPDFSSGHSEPMEYYGVDKFSMENGIDEANKSKGI